MIYPKHYATYKGGSFRHAASSYSLEYVHAFELEDGSLVTERSFDKSGKTPRKYRMAYEWQNGRELMPVGTVVKLFKRGDKWCWRHLGQ